MENGFSTNLQSPGGAVRNSSGIFYVLKDLSSYTLSTYVRAFVPPFPRLQTLTAEGRSQLFKM